MPRASELISGLYCSRGKGNLSVYSTYAKLGETTEYSRYISRLYVLGQNYIVFTLEVMTLLVIFVMPPCATLIHYIQVGKDVSNLNLLSIMMM